MINGHKASKLGKVEKERLTNVLRGKMIQRMAEVKAYMDGLEVHAYMDVFKAVDPTLSRHADHIRQWWTRPYTTLMPQHDPILKKLEVVIERLKAR